MSFKEAAKAQLAAIVAIEASTQVKDNIINKEERELDEQYIAIEIGYKTKIIGEEYYRQLLVSYPISILPFITLCQCQAFLFLVYKCTGALRSS